MTNQLQFTKIGGVTNGIELSCKDGDLSTNDWETYRVRITEEQGDEVSHPYTVFEVDCQMINAGVKGGQSYCSHYLPDYQHHLFQCKHSFQAIQWLASQQGEKIHFYEYLFEAARVFENLLYGSPKLIRIKSKNYTGTLWAVQWEKTTLEQRTEWMRGTVEESEGID